MRRLLALIPVLAVVVGAAMPAQAGHVTTSEVTFTASCLDAHGNVIDGTASATLVGDPVTGAATEPAWGLRRLSVQNPCPTTARIHMIDFNDTQDLPHPHWYITIAPGATRVLGRPGLQKMGIWQLGYTNGGLHVPGQNYSCSFYYGWNLSEILADGHVEPCPPRN